MKLYNRTTLSEKEVLRLYSAIKYKEKGTVKRLKDGYLVSISGYPATIFTEEDRFMRVSLQNEERGYRNLIPGECSEIYFV